MQTECDTWKFIEQMKKLRAQIEAEIEQIKQQLFHVKQFEPDKLYEIENFGLDTLYKR